MKNPKTHFAHFHPLNRDVACYCDNPWPAAAPKTSQRSEVRSSAWLEELQRRVAAAYAETNRLETEAARSERLADEAREKWESLVHELRAASSSNDTNSPTPRS